MAQASLKKDFQRDDSAADCLPYSAHLTESIISTDAGHTMAMFALDGVAHESANADALDLLHESLEGLWRNISGADVAIWTHVIRSQISDYPGGAQPPGSFADQVDRKYRELIAGETLMGNRLYITVVIKPPRGGKIFRSSAKEDQDKRIKRLTDLLRICETSLAPYDARLLRLYEHNGHIYSAPLEVLAYLVNGYWQRILAPRERISNALATSRLVFYKDVVEMRKPAKIEGQPSVGYQAILGVKQYPSGTETGMLNALLTAPFEVVISQSFACMSRTAALSELQKHRRRMVNAGDLAESQIEEIDEGLDDLSSGRCVMGDHHLSIAVKAPSPETLEDNLAEAWAGVQAVMPGAQLAREDMASEAAFWAQFPANFQRRPRPAPITSFNFVGFASLHNYPMGRRTGNQWGPAVMLLKTVSSGPYYLNFHQPIDRQRYGETGDPDEGSSQRVPGNTLVIGPTGSGKTVAAGMALTMGEKFGGPRMIFDKDRGLEILIRALGGTYLPLKVGEPTGFNPFQQPDSNNYRQFLYRLVGKLVAQSVTVDVHKERDIVSAIDRTMGDLPFEHRRLQAVKQTATDPDVIDALDKWTAGGENAWVFDNTTDDLDLSEGRLFGFDVTEFLKINDLRTPIVMYVMERMRALLQGQRFICWMDEFANLLRDPEFDGPVQDLLETIRKLNGVMLLSCQSPTQVVESRIASSVIEQTATMILYPNPSADKDHLRSLSLSEREIELVTGNDDMPIGSRRMLVKQGQQSVVTELDLRGFSDELAVISGTAENVGIMHECRREHGEDDWLTHFYERRV